MCDLITVPRLLFDGWAKEDYVAIFSHESQLQALAKSIVAFYKVSLYFSCYGYQPTYECSIYTLSHLENDRDVTQRVKG